MGLLEDGTEYLRRSGRNLGGLLEWLRQVDHSAAESLKALSPENVVNAHYDAIGGREYGTGRELGALERLGGLFPAAGAEGGGLIAPATSAGSVTLGTYAGITAKTANKQMLGKAKAAINRGEDAETVRQRTGWFQDPAGDWKFEISDHAAELRQRPDGSYTLHHPELRRAYPDMVDSLKIETIPAKNSMGTENSLLGTFNDRTNTAKINESLLKPTMNKPPEFDPLGVLMHEIQHGVQRREGFSPGTNPGSSHVKHLANTDYALERAAVDKAIDAVRQERNRWFEQPGNQTKSIEDFDKANPDWDGRYREAIKAANSFPDLGEWMHRKYESALGEVEARDTQQRLRLTPEQRKAQRPYDVPYSGKYGNVPPQDIWDVRQVDRWMNGQFDPEHRILTAEQKGLIGGLLGLGLFPGSTE